MNDWYTSSWCATLRMSSAAGCAASSWPLGWWSRSNEGADVDRRVASATDAAVRVDLLAHRRPGLPERRVVPRGFASSPSRVSVLLPLLGEAAARAPSRPRGNAMLTTRETSDNGHDCSVYENENHSWRTYIARASERTGGSERANTRSAPSPSRRSVTVGRVRNVRAEATHVPPRPSICYLGAPTRRPPWQRLSMSGRLHRPRSDGPRSWTLGRCSSIWSTGMAERRRRCRSPHPMTRIPGASRSPLPRPMVSGGRRAGLMLLSCSGDSLECRMGVRNRPSAPDYGMAAWGGGRFQDLASVASSSASAVRAWSTEQQRVRVDQHRVREHCEEVVHDARPADQAASVHDGFVALPHSQRTALNRSVRASISRPSIVSR